MLHCTLLYSQGYLLFAAYCIEPLRYGFVRCGYKNLLKTIINTASNLNDYESTI